MWWWNRERRYSPRRHEEHEGCNAKKMTLHPLRDLRVFVVRTVIGLASPPTKIAPAAGVAFAIRRTQSSSSVVLVLEIPSRGKAEGRKGICSRTKDEDRPFGVAQGLAAALRTSTHATHASERRQRRAALQFTKNQALAHWRSATAAREDARPPVAEETLSQLDPIRRTRIRCRGENAADGPV